MSYLLVPIDSIIDNTVTDFNLYCMRREELVLYSTEGYHWVKDEIERLYSFGCGHLFTEPTNIERIRTYDLLNKLPMVDNNLKPQERIRQIDEIGALFTRTLFESDITKSCLKKAEVLADSLTSCILEDKGCVKALKRIVDKDEYVLHHSMRVATLSCAIAIELGVSDTNALKLQAFGGIFHDVGKSQVPSEILNKQGVLSDEEWKVMRSHPEVGFEYFVDSKLEEVPKEIILHHHERLDGTGYPHGLNRYNLLPEVQIATLADVFDALTSSRSYQKSRTKYEALELIKSKMLGSHIDQEIFKGLIYCLK